MNDARTILVICPAALECVASARLLAAALTALGAKVSVYDMTAPYDDVLDEVVKAETIVVWR